MATSKERQIDRDKKVEVLIEKVDKIIEILEKLPKAKVKK